MQWSNLGWLWEPFICVNTIEQTHYIHMLCTNYTSMLYVKCNICCLLYHTHTHVVVCDTIHACGMLCVKFNLIQLYHTLLLHAYLAYYSM